MEKTFILLVIIGLGFLLQKKIKSPEQLKGLKVLILSVALPATIFAALLKVKVDTEMLLLPLLGLVVNLVLFGVFYLIFKTIIPVSNDKRRTFLMLLPSLAPGLSCFPFIAEYLGADALAKAALADVGNKVFVLILLYLLAMKWHYRNSELKIEPKANRVGALLIALGKEPINLVIIVAFILLGFGVNMETLPLAISTPILRLSAMMAPLVLLFIGMAVRIKKDDAGVIFRVLILRSGLAFLLCAGLMLILPDLTVTMILLLLVFSQSSASFWPYAHINVVGEMERDAKRKTFNGGLALSILALSLPFSTLVILSILSVPAIASLPIYPAAVGAILVCTSLFPSLFMRLRGLSAPIKRKGVEVLTGK